MIQSLRAIVIVLGFCVLPVSGSGLWSELYQERLEQARQGSADAQFEVGAMFEKGRGVAADRDEATEWYRKAAGQGHGRAASALARMEDNAQRLAKTQAQAESGDAEAQYNLGSMYLTGTGTGVDLKLAELWLKRAAVQGLDKAQYKLGHLHYVTLGESSDSSIAFEWFSKAAAANYPPAMYYLGDMYANGSGVKQDYAKARSWYEQAGAAGFSLASQALRDLDERSARDEARRLAQETAANAAATAAAAKAVAEPPATTAAVEVKLNPLERILNSQWKIGLSQARFLPSRVSRCEAHADSLVCYSRELARPDLPQVNYKVKSIIRINGGDNQFKIVYRELVLQPLTENATDEAETQEAAPISYGWQEAHTLSCTLAAPSRLKCIEGNGQIQEFIGS
jgi:uncharacterized protein